jgi:hypothetical protein
MQQSATQVKKRAYNGPTRLFNSEAMAAGWSNLLEN